MKKNRFYQLSMLVMAAGMFAACSSDEPQSEIVGPDGETAYAKVCITFPGSERFGSRAFGSGSDEFDDGETSEGTINSLLFVFYDQDGRAVGHTKLTNTTTPKIPTPTHTSSANVQDKYVVEVPVNLVPGSKMPTHIMCFANPQSESDQYVNLSAVYNLTRPDYKSTDGFTMNNSVYYDGSNNRVIATPIPTGGLRKQGETTALAETNIYIERIASKVSVNTGTGYKVDTYEVNTGKYLKFVPEYWSVTATEKSTELVKNLPATLSGNDATVQTWIKGSFRTFWAHSVSYQPTFSADGFPKTGWDVTAATKLNYLSYNDIIAKKTAGAAEWGGNQYFLETTGRSERLSRTDINGKLALPNAVIVGHYEVYSDAAATTKLAVYDNGFYLYASQVFEPSEIENAMISNHAAYLRKAENTPLTATEVAALFDVAAVKEFYRNGAWTAAAKHYVAPQTTAAKIQALAGLQYKDDDGTWKNVESTAVGVEAFNKFIVKQTNCALSYVKGGKAFYTVLIEHYGEVADGTATKPVEGSYGLVRNHTYRISISKIAGLASGINDENDPLIPMPDEVTKFEVSAHLNVLAWHVITQSGVEL